MSLRSDRARRRAARRRNLRIIFGAVILLVLAAVGFFAYTAFFAPSPKAEVITTASGLQYQDLVVGSGAVAQPVDTLVVNYTGKLENGTVFDSTDNRGPFTFVLQQGQVIQGWVEGIAGMREGGERRLIIPPDLAYGASGYPPTIPPNATLIFDVELLQVNP